MGIVGGTGVGPAKPTVGDTLKVGTAAAELTPRLPISMDPNGIPVRAPPPSVVGDIEVGVEEEAMLLEPEPHIPDIPEVSSIPDVVDIPDVGAIPDEVDIPDVAMLPEVAAVAGAALPIAIPPPSKLAVDPNIDDGAVPKVEHVVPLLGIAIVPVAPVGAGLTPGDAISVEPRGMPVEETVEPDPMPSGEVAPRVGVGLAIPLTCAMALWQTSSAGRIVRINESFIGMLLWKPVRNASAHQRDKGARVFRPSLHESGRALASGQLNTSLFSGFDPAAVGRVSELHRGWPLSET
jgi:hypothetical protein